MSVLKRALVKISYLAETAGDKTVQSKPSWPYQSAPADNTFLLYGNLLN